MNEEFQKYLKLANDFLAKKERVNYYETKAINEPYYDYATILTSLSDEEVSMTRALKERYGDDFINHLEEVFHDPDYISDMFFGEPVDIDLDTVYHQYRFTLSEVDGDKVSSRQVLIQLSDEDYAKLLAWHLCDSHLVINTLFYRDENLARRIMREAMSYQCDEGFPMINHPYVIVMDEALADAELIREENGLAKSEGYLFLFF